MGVTNVSGKSYDDELNDVRSQINGRVISVNHKTGSDIILSSSDIMHVDQNNIVQPISETIGELKNSVADGKNAVANAISEKGIVATGSESFADLSSKIDQIKQGVGNATAEDVLSGKTFSNNASTNLVGSMPNNGTVSHNLVTNNASYAIPAGYHSGSGRVYCKPTNLIAGNIRKGATVGGVVGSYAGITGLAFQLGYDLGHSGRVQSGRSWTETLNPVTPSIPMSRVKMFSVFFDEYKLVSGASGDKYGPNLHQQAAGVFTYGVAKYGYFNISRSTGAGDYLGFRMYYNGSDKITFDKISPDIDIVGWSFIYAYV